MFLKSVIIENFRCLKKVELQLNKTTVFIGENNSGKTACLEAIKTILGRMSTTAAFEEYDYYAEGNDSAPQSSEGISIKTNTSFLFEYKILSNKSSRRKFL